MVQSAQPATKAPAGGGGGRRARPPVLQRACLPPCSLMIIPGDLHAVQDQAPPVQGRIKCASWGLDLAPTRRPPRAHSRRTVAVSRGKGGPVSRTPPRPGKARHAGGRGARPRQLSSFEGLFTQPARCRHVELAATTRLTPRDSPSADPSPPPACRPRSVRPRASTQPWRRREAFLKLLLGQPWLWS